MLGLVLWLLSLELFHYFHGTHYSVCISKKKKGPSIVDSVKVPFIILLVTCGKFICVPNNEKYFT